MGRDFGVGPRRCCWFCSTADIAAMGVLLRMGRKEGSCDGGNEQGAVRAGVEIDAIFLGFERIWKAVLCRERAVVRDEPRQGCPYLTNYRGDVVGIATGGEKS